MTTVSVFISHSWSYSNHYDTLSEWIFRNQWYAEGGAPLLFVDHSVPKNNPIHYAPNEETLKAAIFEKIAYSHVVVIPRGMYANHSRWIGKEIIGARLYGKPILAVNPWAQERKSSAVGSAANLNVGWNKKPVVQAVWDLARGAVR
jgi:hypothetical protein